MNNEAQNKIGLIEKTSILKADSNVLFLQKKSEKISAAVYMLTNFFSPEEPLKWAMREDAVSLIKDMNALSRISLGQKESVVRTAASHIGQITTLIELGRAAGFVSPMNADIIVSELASLLARLEQKESQELSVNSLPFNTSFFDARIPAETEVRKEVLGTNVSYGGGSVSYKGQDKSHTTDNVLYKQPQREAAHQVQQQPRTQTHSHTYGNHAKSNRQESILKALTKGDYMSIKDLLKHVKGCSEKTLQRELIVLLAKGQIKRTGERRWSTYSLV